MEFDFSPIFENWRYLRDGLLITISLSVLSIIAASILGGAIGLARVYGPRWLAGVLAFYVDSARSIPALVVLIWMYFAFPLMVGISLPPFWAAFIALSAYIAAYISEIVRGGVLSIRSGQTRAAKALGMSQNQTILKIILPQAVVRILPQYGNMLSITVKNSAICSVIAVPDYLQNSGIVAAQTYRPLEIYTVALIVYIAMILPLTRSTDWLYSRLSHLGRS
ncbi:amino acid ABC transporter permease [Phyllobacterium chamaecytisi]|uniref:amino acid ABC transporter permease n=1 Tax=Phyllobacterium chamaecytisi TaxID=2876082 RepID=UPI001CCB08C8|nr:amino acid ABC transporter permease [Phyllobacterium sp. KW56]MBZ9603287.1 amino acid ABC transporter permease [Phyllobacterium sp. KW56]